MSTKKRAVWGWALYDWANSVFATSVMGVIFPYFFKVYYSAGVNPNLSTFRLGMTTSLASLIVAILAPVLGAVSDQGGLRKRFLLGFAYLGALMTCGLYLVDKGQWQMAVVIYTFGLIGFAGANIFYDSLLPHVAPPDRYDRVSSFGFSLGYLGGGLLFAVHLVMLIQPQVFGFADAAAAVRVAFVSTGIWWGGFTLFTWWWVPRDPKPGDALPWGAVIRKGLSTYMSTLREVRQRKNVFLFLLAYWFYIDGVGTIIKMATDYGLSLGFEIKELSIAFLIVQFVGFPMAVVFGRLAERWSVRKAIFLAIAVYIMVSIWGTFMRDSRDFYVLAVAIGLVQGGIQALSRSYYSRLIPAGRSGEFFGFYNMLGKFAAILGPFLVGSVGLLVRRMLIQPGATADEVTRIGHIASRFGIASVIILFIAGAVLLWFVKEPESMEKGGQGV